MQNNTQPIHTFYSSSASYKVEKIKHNRGIKFHYIQKNSLLVYMVIPLGILFISLLDDVSFWAIFIFLGVIISIVFFKSMIGNEILTFDTQRKVFYKLHKKTKKKSDLITFSRIEAIQLLHYVETTTHTDNDDDGFDDSYETYDDAYELNLVLENRRISIEANSDYEAIKKNARKVSNLLNVPIVEVYDK